MNIFQMSFWNKLWTNCKINIHDSNGKVLFDDSKGKTFISYLNANYDMNFKNAAEQIIANGKHSDDDDDDNGIILHPNEFISEESTRNPVTRQMSVSRSGRYKQRQLRRSALFDIPELVNDICESKQNKGEHNLEDDKNVSSDQKEGHLSSRDGVRVH